MFIFSHQKPSHNKIKNNQKEKNFEQTLNRVDEELNKGQGMLEDIASSPTVYKNNRDKNIGNFREVIDKLTSSLKENKIILIAIINFYMKISRTYYYVINNIQRLNNFFFSIHYNILSKRYLNPYINLIH